MTSVWLFLIFVSNTLKFGLPLPLPSAKSLADPQLQFQPLPRSSQQFTMYRQLNQQLRYPPGPGPFQQYQYPPGVPVRLSASGQPLALQPIVHYSYNITHPVRRPGIVLTHHQLQHLSHQKGLQDRQQLPSALKSQQRPAYSTVVLGNPNVINLQTQFQPQNLIQNISNTATVQLQVPLQDIRETEPEDAGIGFRVFNQRKKYRGPPGSASRIVFDQQRPSQQILNQALRYPDQIVFGSGQRPPNQLGSLPQARQPYVPLQFENISATVPTVIQVPYLTTLSPLQQLLKNKNQAGFRSLLVSSNPGLQASISSTINRNNQLILSGRGARVQNFVVPNFIQTPAGTQLLQQNPAGVQQQSVLTPSNLFSNQIRQGTQASFSNQVVLTQQRSFANQINPSLIRGTSITPENQRNLGQFLFTDPSGNDPNNPNDNTNSIAIPNLANTAQKVFILPPQSPPNAGLNQNNSDDPAEIVVTVVDESPGSEFSLEDASKDSSRSKVLTNFSLFLVPSTYKRCFEGYRKAHDGKCRLIIKLRSRNTG